MARQMFATIEHYEGFDVTTAVFFDRADAEAFAKTENDAVQAELVTVEDLTVETN